MPGGHVLAGHLVLLLEVGLTDLCVAQGHADVRVPEERLDGRQAHPHPQHLGGKQDLLTRL